MRRTLHANGRGDAGGSALVMHNERLADPLDPVVRQIAEFTKKRTKTESDHLEIARLEFHGGLYLNDNGPAIPAWNALRCLQDGAKRHKRGPDVLRGVYPLGDSADLQYDGPRDPDELWKAGRFSLRKSVGVQRARTMRTRPIFLDWSFDLPIEVDETVWDTDQLAFMWQQAGVYAGLGEMRPVYGRFLGTVTADEQALASVASNGKAKR